MSWSARYTYGAEGGVDFSGNPEMPEVATQFDQAVKSVNYLIQSGVLGSPNGKYNIFLSGHANENHQPKEGWSNDSVTISITQI